FAFLRNAIVGGPLLAELAPITGPMYQLFVFFMVTDPRTTVSTRRGRIVVVAIVALVETLIRLAGDFQLPLLRPFYVSPPILALSIVGRSRCGGTFGGRPGLRCHDPQDRLGRDGGPRAVHRALRNRAAVRPRDATALHARSLPRNPTRRVHAPRRFRPGDSRRTVSAQCTSAQS